MAEKKKRTPQEVKLAKLMMKKIGYSVEPKTCVNCKLSTPDVPEIFEGCDLGCKKFEELVVFGVKNEGSCAAWKKKPSKRAPKRAPKSDGGEASEAAKPPVKPAAKPKSTKKGKK